MKRNFAGLSIAITLLVATSAFASPILRISSAGDSCTLSDGDAAAVCVGAGFGSGDILSGISGAVSGSFTVGLFTVNVVTGFSKPSLGSALSPHMELNTVNKSSGAGILTIEFTDDSFEGFGDSLLTFGGVAGGTAVYSAYADDFGNVPFARTTLLGTSGLLGSGAYGGTLAGGTIGSESPYSLTQVVTFTHSAADVSSGDHELNFHGRGRSVPEPGILSLLSVGLLGLGVIRRRLQRSLRPAHLFR